MKSYKVVIWKLSINRSAKKPTYLVRWSVDGEPFHESHKTKALADRFRAKLLRAADKGEPFDTVTGLPDSLRGGRRRCRSSTWRGSTWTRVGQKRQRSNGTA